MGTEKSIVLFESADKKITLDVGFDGETVWLSQAQMAELFATTKQNVSLHVNNCFREGELEPEAVVKDSLTTAADGKRYRVRLYNLDVIISVGYRVKSARGVEFRRWATDVLRRYIVRFGGEGSLFGVEKDESFKGAIGNVFQSFDGRDLYSTLEE